MAWVRELEQGGPYFALREPVATGGVDFKILTWTELATLAPGTNAVEILAVELDITTSAVAGTRQPFWWLLPEGGVGKVMRAGYQFSETVAPNEELIIMAAPGLPEGTKQAVLAGTSEGATWNGIETVTNPWPPNFFMSSGTELHFEIAAADETAVTGDDFVVELFCRSL
jgi:hypothetical protein